MNDISYEEPAAQMPAGGSGDPSHYYGEGFWMAFFQGHISKENFYLLIAAMTCVYGTLLPWYAVPATDAGVVAGEVLKGIDYASGAVICFFSLLAACVMIYNIRARRLLFWPILLMLVENIFVLVLHYMRTGPGLVKPFSGDGSIKEMLWDAYRSQGIGIYFVTVGTFFVLLQILMSVFKAAGKDKDQPAKRPVASGGGGGGRRRR